MKRWKSPIGGLLAFCLLVVFLTGCGNQANDSSGDTKDSGTDDGIFSYSDGIDDNGYWKDITAGDLVEMFDYKALPVPASAHEVTDDDIQKEIDSLLSEYATKEQVTDRAVEDGDTVNIDYVGSVDGVEFEGGTTGGAGTEVTIGVTNYIDDFLEQLIGHAPGETFNVEVTFPEDYGKDDLNGKDAVFVTTINHVVISKIPELTDEFVAENLSEEHSWMTVAEMTDAIREDLQKAAVLAYVQEYLTHDVTIDTLPESLIEYQENALRSYCEEYAVYFGVEMDEFLNTYMGAASMEELLEDYYEYNLEAARYYLVIQAVAEDAEIVPTEEDVSNYFSNYVGTDDYSEYEEQYGMPYLKQMALCQLVLDYIVEHAVLQ